MARKQATFKSLLDYMHKECTKDSLSTKRNILSENREDIAREFEENARYLPKRKGGNYLYHEIITIPKQEKLSSLKQQKILIDLADKYLEKRAENLLSYGVIHTDTNNLHIHLLISANEPLSKKRYRLNKRKFAEIQKEIELYKLEKYPELETKKIYTKDIQKEKQKSISNREFEVIKRGGTSKKQEIIDITRDIIFRAKDKDNYYIVRANALEDNYRLYTFVNGRRQQLASATVSAPEKNKFHNMRIVARGDHIQAYLDGKLQIDYHDDTYQNGFSGLWTKEDSITQYDNFKAGSLSE